ncbi:MAG: 2-amino-4-hydroxy-6-hydroxymethyldihydropteridine diphosphokinase [Clostridia bacterium]|nr:2-amino-4-hydroxy-6-hydroxymethyldihydropteridine diphosphokinase [Clostridia bacterium]
MKAVIGIGTNIGDRYSNIENAVVALERVPGVCVIRKSCVYETEPWGYTDQNGFYNNVIEVETEKSPQALLGICLGIEAGMGRVREFKYGPRVIDLDLLLYEGAVSDTEELRLPHPLIGERDFVLVPLRELFPDMKVFGFEYEESYRNICKNTTAKKVEKS